MAKEIARAISSQAYKTYEKRLMSDVMNEDRPHHLAIIMDGNRRFAQEIGLHTLEGHQKGKEKLEEVLEWCQEVGITVLTVYAFSTENLNRNPEEVEHLMEMFVESFRSLGDEERIHKNKIHVQSIGQRDLLPPSVQEAIQYAEDRTKDYKNHYYNIAIAYGSREEIIQAIQRIATDVKDGKLEASGINEDTVSSYLYTSDFPDPDLVLRTSGEERVSNFLLWQVAYSELYFADVYWPGFRKIDFLRAIRSYQQRQRRYGR